ncbi:MAG: hypothetical protein E7658_08640 [Ruminococcaceae bacterium]|nr:hypothetical protein [Oscillospiraceae bacterium]
MKNYENEVRERWENTETYREYTEKTENYTEDQWSEKSEGLMAIFAVFAACMKNGSAADSDEAKALAGKLQEYITENYYECTDRILAGLGQMYNADGRFRDNIDKYGPGTAEFASAAIKAYCKERRAE